MNVALSVLTHRLHHSILDFAIAVLLHPGLLDDYCPPLPGCLHRGWFWDRFRKCYETFFPLLGEPVYYCGPRTPSAGWKVNMGPFIAVRFECSKECVFTLIRKSQSSTWKAMSLTPSPCFIRCLPITEKNNNNTPKLVMCPFFFFTFVNIYKWAIQVYSRQNSPSFPGFNADSNANRICGVT